jgi:non-ribosomal peptide synthetase component E (peptide arylation enzyme)
MQPTTSKSSSGAADWQLDAAMAADITLDALFRRAFRVFADRTAVTWEGGQRRYREVGERAWRLANAVRAKGYDRGDTTRRHVRNMLNAMRPWPHSASPSRR